VIEQFQETIRSAAAGKTPLRLRGSGSKDFYGLHLEGDILDTRAYSGIVEYEPTELVFTARAGTPLRDVEAALAENGQTLPFEPPHFGPDATFGGCIASGFSGPRRAHQGSARDFVLGIRMLNSRGEDLQFGGQVGGFRRLRGWPWLLRHLVQQRPQRLTEAPRADALQIEPGDQFLYRLAATQIRRQDRPRHHPQSAHKFDCRPVRTPDHMPCDPALPS